MPKLLTQGVSLEPKNGRQLIGIVAGFKSERWPVIDRNAGRLQIGIRKRLPYTLPRHPHPDRYHRHGLRNERARLLDPVYDDRASGVQQPRALANGFYQSGRFYNIGA